jgi:hypothetical protein
VINPGFTDWLTAANPLDFTLRLLSLGGGSFLAGCIDAIVGGGGLIQLPILLLLFPQVPIATLFGTNKLASIAGTTIAIVQYRKRVELPHWVWAAAIVAGNLVLYRSKIRCPAQPSHPKTPGSPAPNHRRHLQRRQARPGPSQPPAPRPIGLDCHNNWRSSRPLRRLFWPGYRQLSDPGDDRIARPQFFDRIRRRQGD